MNETNATDVSDGSLICSYVYLCIVMAIGIPGNAMILLVVSSVRLKSHMANYIISIAANDLIFSCLMVPTDIILITGYVESLNSTSMANIFCKIKGFIRCVLSVSESLIICLIAFDRYYRVVRPHCKFFLSKKSKAGIMGCFCIAAFVAVPALMFEWDAADLQCRPGEQVFKKFYVMFHCLLSLFVAGTITFSYSYIALVVRKAAKGMIVQAEYIARKGEDFANETQNAIPKSQADINVAISSGKKRTQHLRTIFTLFIFSFVYILSWLPNWIQYILYAATSYRNSSLDFLLTKSYHVNAFANVIVYIICNPSFRKKTHEIFCSCYHL